MHHTRRFMNNRSAMRRSVADELNRLAQAIVVELVMREEVASAPAAQQVSVCGVVRRVRGSSQGRPRYEDDDGECGHDLLHSFGVNFFESYHAPTYQRGYAYGGDHVDE